MDEHESVNGEDFIFGNNPEAHKKADEVLGGEKSGESILFGDDEVIDAEASEVLDEPVAEKNEVVVFGGAKKDGPDRVKDPAMVWIVDDEGKYRNIPITELKDGQRQESFVDGDKTPNDGDVDPGFVKDEVKKEESEKNDLSKEDFLKWSKDSLIASSKVNILPTDRPDVIEYKNQQKITRDEARKKLREYGVDVDYMTAREIKGNSPVDIENRRKRKSGIEKTIDGVQKGKITPEQRDLLERIKVGEDILEDWKVEVVIVLDEADLPDTERVVVEPEPRPEKKAKPNFRIKTVGDLNAFLEAAKRADMEERALINRLAREQGYLLDDLMDTSLDLERKREIELLGRDIKKLIDSYRKDTAVGVKNVEGDIPKTESYSDWVRWLRSKLQPTIEPILGAGSQRGEFHNLLKVYSTDPVSGVRREELGTNYAPARVKAEILESGGEIDVLKSLVGIFDGWRRFHKDFKRMIGAFEENSDYMYPDSRLANNILREFKDEFGGVGEGAKKIGRVIQIYWAMANLDNPDSLDILRDNGMDGSWSLFSNRFSDDSVRVVREKVANVVGGAYYENLGMMYSNFLGLAAKGGVGKDSSVPDTMSSFYNIDKLETLSVDLKKAFIVAGTKGSKKITFMPTLAEIQMKNGNEKNFYIVYQAGTDSMLLKSKLNDGERDSGLSVDDVIKNGYLHKIDWTGGDVDLFSEIKKKEKMAVKMNAVFSNIEDSPGDTLKSPDYSGSKSWHKKIETIRDSLSHYDLRTRQRVYFLWLWRQLEFNTKWRNDPKEQENIHLIVNTMRSKGKWYSRTSPCLHEDDYKELKRRFNLGKTPSTSYSEAGLKSEFGLLSKNYKYRKTGIPPRVDF